MAERRRWALRRQEVPARYDADGACVASGWDLAQGAVIEDGCIECPAECGTRAAVVAHPVAGRIVLRVVDHPARQAGDLASAGGGQRSSPGRIRARRRPTRRGSSPTLCTVALILVGSVPTTAGLTSAQVAPWIMAALLVMVLAITVVALATPHSDCRRTDCSQRHNPWHSPT
jgi:hypothetical protein